MVGEMKLTHAMALALSRYRLVVVVATGFKLEDCNLRGGRSRHGLCRLYGVSIVQHNLAGRRVIVG